MRRWELEAALQEVEAFRAPKYELEQYPTSAHLASCVVHTAHSCYGDIEGKRVLDLGCGTGMLGIGAIMLGASSVTGVDVDPDALEVAVDNAKALGILNDGDDQDDDDDDDEEACGSFDMIMANVEKLPFQFDASSPPFNTVLMNPPFGTRKKGIDVRFLRAAVDACSGAVYSLHKTSTRSYLEKKIKSWGLGVEVVAELKFDIPKMYKFHTKKSADVQVDLIRAYHHHHSQ